MPISVANVESNLYYIERGLTIGWGIILNVDSSCLGHCGCFLLKVRSLVHFAKPSIRPIVNVVREMRGIIC